MGVWTRCADVLAHGCVACPCGCGWWMGVWMQCMSVRMHCVQTDEGKEKNKKEKPKMRVVDTGTQECGCVACVYGCV